MVETNRQARAEATRLQLVQAASGVFADRGYRGATVAAITERAETAHGTFYLYFEDKPTDMDETFEDKGVKLFIDPLSYQYLEGTEIDYVEGLHGSGFKFGNPNVKSTCGCGSSFSA